MLASQRQSRILEEIRRSGAARVSELTDLLGVSDMTIRRDLEQLASSGVVHKVHGGAVLNAAATEEPGFAVKSELEQVAKVSIAALAASFIRPGSAIALSAGTTVYNLARHIAAVPGLTIVTNSTAVADLIAGGSGGPGQTVILTGGVRTPSAALVGPVADLALRSLHVDQLFLGVHGMDATAGFTTPNLAEAETNRALIEGARQVIICADSTKWGSVGLASFAPLSTADILVTDSGLSVDATAILSEEVGSLRIAKVERAEWANG
ncbi:MAG: DeoR/GlpR family DNA-binding transcription regulator [Actinomycetota bacterium]|nr:DeoR/GlpR family DNA-binding transcription regulator [Actinomycetota bacterium]